MCGLFTERNGLRPPMPPTSIVNPEIYKLLLDCCRKYLVNLAKQFPAVCPDNTDEICGVDHDKLCRYLNVRIPGLCRKYANTFDFIEPNDDNYACDQYALLDGIEFIAQNMKTVERRFWHKHYNHSHMEFYNHSADFMKFQCEINAIFEMGRLRFRLGDNKQINRVTNADELLQVAEVRLTDVPEEKLKELLESALTLYRKPKPSDHHLATEKLWDSLERLKSLYALKKEGKKQSVHILINKMAQEHPEFADILEDEFGKLSKIGNGFTIRHHEQYIANIGDNRFYDYLFQRCLALIVLAIEMVFCHEQNFAD